MDDYNPTLIHTAPQHRNPDRRRCRMSPDTVARLASALLTSEEGSTEWSEALTAYQNACADVGLHYSSWNDYLRGSDTVEELIAYTLPRAIAAARSN